MKHYKLFVGRREKENWSLQYFNTYSGNSRHEAKSFLISRQRNISTEVFFYGKRKLQWIWNMGSYEVAGPAGRWTTGSYSSSSISSWFAFSAFLEPSALSPGRNAEANKWRFKAGLAKPHVSAISTSSPELRKVLPLYFPFNEIYPEVPSSDFQRCPMGEGNWILIVVLAQQCITTRFCGSTSAGCTYRTLYN